MESPAAPWYQATGPAFRTRVAPRDRRLKQVTDIRGSVGLLYISLMSLDMKAVTGDLHSPIQGSHAEWINAAEKNVFKQIILVVCIYINI